MTIDKTSPFNVSILACLALPLGEASPALITYFEECVARLNEERPGIEQVNNYPVYVDPITGIIHAAVCGASGVALRLASMVRPQMVKAGAKDYVEYSGGRFPLVGVAGSTGDGWIVTDGSLVDKMMMIRYGLLTMAVALRPAPDKSKPETYQATLDHPANARLLDYLQAQYPEGTRIPSYHPDIPDFANHDLPKLAKIEVISQLIFTRRGLIHPTNKVIFAFLKDEGVFGVRMSADDRAAVLALTDGPKLYPEIGEEWIRFPLFSYQKLSPQWLAQSYQYTGTL